MSLAGEQFVRTAQLAWSLEHDYPHNALTSALAGRVAGIPAPVCYAVTTDRLAACSLPPGHEGRHNARHDGSGREW